MSQGRSQWQNLASHNLVLQRQSVVVLTVLFTIHAPYSLVRISQLVCLPPVGIFKPLMFIRNICFLHFECHACELACVAKCMTTINKHLFIYLFYFFYKGDSKDNSWPKKILLFTKESPDYLDVISASNISKHSFC